MKSSIHLLLATVLVAIYSGTASAELAFHDPATQMGVLDQVIQVFIAKAHTWQVNILEAASWLFWTLGTISLTWTMGMLAIRKADLAELFAELIRFILVFGFFYWLLKNGPYFAETIISSLRLIGERSSGTDGLSPSGIVDVGFMVWKQAIANTSKWSPVDSFVGLVISACVLIVLALIAVNMLLLLTAGWVLMYAGMIFLGFGGSRWTSDMAINYFRTVLGLAVQLLVMTLLVGIGTDLLTSFYNKMGKGTLNFEELGVMLVVSIALLILTNQAPKMVAGIASGGQGGTGGSSFGAGAAVGAVMGAAGMAGAAASMAGAAAMGGAQNAAGGASALMAAVRSAQSSMSSGSSISSPSASSGSDNSADGGGSLFEAMGISSQSSGGSMQRAVSLAAGAASELGKGAAGLIKEKADSAASSFQEKAGNTLGGQLAARIDSEWSTDDAISAPQSDSASSREAEIAAFVNGTHRTDA